LYAGFWKDLRLLVANDIGPFVNASRSTSVCFADVFFADIVLMEYSCVVDIQCALMIVAFTPWQSFWHRLESWPLKSTWSQKNCVLIVNCEAWFYMVGLRLETSCQTCRLAVTSLWQHLAVLLT
jgi:hypothetical protein